MDTITIIGIVATYLIFIVVQHVLNWVLRLSNQEDMDPDSQAFLILIFILAQLAWVVTFIAFTKELIETY